MMPVEATITLIGAASRWLANYTSYLTIPLIIIGISEVLVPKAVNTFISVQKTLNKITGEK